MKCLLFTVDVPGLLLSQSTENQWIACCLHAPLALYMHPSQWVTDSSWDSAELGKKLSYICTRRRCELSAGLDKQRGCETDGKIQEEQQLFPPTESALHGQTCFFFFFPEVTTCWLASISAVVCEALASEQHVWELVQRLECKCWNDAEMLQSWPKQLCHSCNRNIWNWLNCSCDVIHWAQMGNQYLVLNFIIFWWNDNIIQTKLRVHWFRTCIKSELDNKI